MTAISFRGQLLWENIKRGDLAAVVNLLENGGINLEEKDENGQTFLMLACEKGELSIVRELLENDVDVNALDNESWSALLCAAREGHLEIVIELIERNAILEHRDMFNWTALMWACYKGKTTVVQELLERGANANVKADHNMTCLSWAAGRGYTEVVSMLIQNGAKVNAPDKYGTTPLIWACRKGYQQIANLLLQESPSVDVAGMNSWTALLAATRGGFTEVVSEILQYNANPNALDKDGFTALTIAAKEGYIEIAQDLLAHGAYVNLRDRDGDSILIHAVKGGHIEVVQSLLNKYADVDIQGSEGKTAVYWGIEKGHNDIVRLLLSNDADTEITTKDNDTPLLRAVKSRNEECVRLLLEKNAKVSNMDKKGDSALHISLRARSKRITELLLRNPKNSRLLYRHNKAGETPYSIDAYYQKGILTQIFGHRKLNANDGENLLGYEIYSSALADILSEPALNTPITVGLYAKWGSGKSFLLGKLQNEMKSFTQQYLQEQFHFNRFIFFLFFSLNLVVGLVLGLSTFWGIGLGVGLGLFIPEYGFLAFIYVASHKYDMDFASRLSISLRRKVDVFKRILKLVFYTPKKHTDTDVPRVRFLFSDYTRITSVGGEKALAAMIGTLCDAVEQEHSFIVTRLYKIFRPESGALGLRGRYKSICCIPYFFLVILVGLCLVTGIVLLVIYKIDNSTVNVVLITLLCVVGLAIVGNLYTWCQAIVSLNSSQKSRLLQAADQLETLKVDGFMQKIKEEVDLMSEMVGHMDRFTGNETRLVVVVDGLDSCEQDKVLQFLDTVKTLFAETDSPFITVLAVDPHIIIRGIEQNLCTSFHDTNIHGYEYLRNIVHLPFYLQSQGVRVQKEDYMVRGSSSISNDFSHQEATVSSLSLAEHKHKKSSNNRRKQTQRLNSSTWHTSSFDLSKTLIKNDYFSDINPRSMRRLMNIVAVTGRLLRAYNIEFSWLRLAGWINLIEQWPYRVSWMIFFWEEQGGLDEGNTLQDIYNRIESSIPTSKDVEPLLEIDRNVRKLETFLNTNSPNTPSLTVGDLKKFLPCTINLDPYLRKLIRDLQHNVDVNRSEYSYMLPFSSAASGSSDQRHGYGRLNNFNRQSFSPRGTPSRTSSQTTNRMAQHNPRILPQAAVQQYLMSLVQSQLSAPPNSRRSPIDSLPAETVSPHTLINGTLKEERLSHMTTQDVCDLLERVDGLNKQALAEYQAQILSNNISGIVLMTCDLNELKLEMKMKFGDWQIFRVLILSLRRVESQGDQATDHYSNSNDDRFDSADSRGFADTYKPQTFTANSRVPGERRLEAPVARYPSNNQTAAISSSSSSTVKSSSNSDVFDTSPGGSKAPAKPKPAMRRNNSILEQVEYESEILREVFENYELEEDENEEEEQREEESTDESLKNTRKSSVSQPSSSKLKLPSVRFFVENEEASVQMGNSPNSQCSSVSPSSLSSSTVDVAPSLSSNLGRILDNGEDETGKQSSDSEPLLKQSENREWDNFSKKEKKSTFGLGSLKGKVISEEKRPLDLSSDDDDMTTNDRVPTEPELKVPDSASRTSLPSVGGSPNVLSPKSQSNTSLTSAGSSPAVTTQMSVSRTSLTSISGSPAVVSPTLDEVQIDPNPEVSGDIELQDRPRRPPSSSSDYSVWETRPQSDIEDTVSEEAHKSLV